MLRSIGHSIRTRVMALVMLTTLSALLLSAAGLVVYDLRYYERQASADFTAQADVLARATAPALSFGDRKEAERDLAMIRARPRILAAALYQPDGKLFASYTRPDARVPPFPLSPRAEGYTI